MDELSEAEKDAIAAAIKSNAFTALIGSEEWELTVDQEWALWSAIEKVRG